jgi:hypothetical protein
MWRRLLLINLLLAGLLTAGVLKLRRSGREFDASHRVETIQAEPEAARTIPAISTTSARPEDWTEIPTKNLFSFDRNDIAIVAPKEVQQAGPKPLLFGTMSIGNESIAMLSPGQGRQSTAMKIGESINNWQLVEIQKDSVVMTANGVRTSIGLSDAPRDHTRTGAASSPAAAVTIVSAPPSEPATSAAASAATPTPPPFVQTPNPTPGQGKGHWMYTPFGNVWVADPK